MDHQIFGEFIERLHGLESQAEMLGMWSRQMAELGFEKQMYGLWSAGRQEEPGGSVYMTNYSTGWIEAYQQESLAKVDPVIQHAAMQPLPFTWDRCPIVDPVQARFMDRAAADEGLVAGISSTLPAGVGQFGAVSVCGAQDCEADRQIPLVYAMTSAMHAGLLMQRSRLTLEQVGLTPRELEVFKHLPGDKSYEEIAQIMNLSRRTVVEYATNVAEKLGAHEDVALHGRRGAVAVGLRHGLIELP